jgi:chemotaxis protein MotB
VSEEQSAHHTKNEIIIVKRRPNGDEEGHHGGVWKIAYADFMTAMMAFFHVMWLINAANEQTRVAIASYFNPIKLVDEHPADKGIKKDGKAAKDGEQQQQSATKGADVSSGDGADTGHQKRSTAGKETKYSEADYFKNPYSVLSEIARETGHDANISPKGNGGAQVSGPATGASGGKAYRDPFDPDFWVQQVASAVGRSAAENDVAASLPGAEPSAGKETKLAEKPAKALDHERADRKPAEAKAAGKHGSAASQEAVKASEALAKAEKPETAKAAPGAGKAEAAKADTDATKSVVAPKAAAPNVAEAAAEKLKAEITKATGGAIGTLGKAISVKAAEGGVLVSITDRADDGMFNVGSAVPRHDMVVAMQKIGEILSKRTGQVVIRGYTDARPFSGNGYDNWRLSMARAESAYYMLTRGGLDKSRIMQISGFADRHLLLPDQPYAAANRRIEILLKPKEAKE